MIPSRALSLRHSFLPLRVPLLNLLPADGFAPCFNAGQVPASARVAVAQYWVYLFHCKRTFTRLPSYFAGVGRVDEIFDMAEEDKKVLALQLADWDATRKSKVCSGSMSSRYCTTEQGSAQLKRVVLRMLATAYIVEDRAELAAPLQRWPIV